MAFFREILDVAEGAADSVDGQFGSDFTGVHPAHPVRDDEYGSVFAQREHPVGIRRNEPVGSGQVGIDDEIIFIVAADQADVGRNGHLEGEFGHGK